MSEFHRLECDCERCDLLHAAYDEGVQDSMLRATQIERVLTDLIAELREVFDTHPLAPSLTASVRACMDATEARLKGLNDV